MREAGWCHSKAFHDKWWPKICNVANSVRECFKCWCTFWLAEHMRRESWKTNTNTTTNTNNYSKYKQIWHSWYMGVGKRQITHLSGVVRLVVRHFHFLEGDNLEQHQKWSSAKKSMKSFGEKKNKVFSNLNFTSEKISWDEHFEMHFESFNKNCANCTKV